VNYASKYLLPVLFLLTQLESVAQSFYSVRHERTLIATVGAGSANYFGELVNPGSLGKIKPGLNVGLEKYIFGSGRVSARLEATWYQISGSDASADDDRIVRNLSFSSNNLELSTTATMNLFSAGKRFYQRPNINFYGFVGFGITLINPKTEYNGEKVALRPLQTEGVAYSRVQPVIPFGGGIKFKVGPMFNVSFEGGIRKTFTDYLDDISVRYYPDPATLSSDLARELSNRSGGQARIRGNPEKDDWYFMINARLQYYLPIDFTGGSGGASRKLYTKKRKSFNYNSKRRRR
jgi:Domain of unknown function (DUF6089)